MKANTINLTCLFFAGLVSPTIFAAAAADANPYRLIGHKNSFRLQPLVNTRVEVLSPSAKIGFQGLTTVLGRPLALMKLALPGNAPEVSVILGEGERMACVEVLQINESARSVTVQNGGRWQLLVLEAGDPVPPTSLRQ